jgi:hypothetical protein
MTLIEKAQKLAKRDYAHPLINKSQGWKPGERELKNEIAAIRKNLLKEVKTKADEIGLQKKILENINQHIMIPANDELVEVNNNIGKIEKRKAMVEKQNEGLNTTVLNIEAAYPETETLYDQTADVNIKQDNNGKKNSFSETMAIILLIFLALFDGVNFYYNLRGYENLFFKNILLSSGVIAGVFLFSLRIKKESTTRNWIPYLLFLIAAQIPQFMGQSPHFGVVHLTKNISHILFFVISFFGSLVVTFSLQHRNKNTVSTEEKDPNALKPNIEIVPAEVLNRYKQLKEKVAKNEQEIKRLKDSLAQLSGKRTQIQEQKEKEIKEKENSIYHAAAEIHSAIQDLQDEIDMLEIQIAGLDRETCDAIEVYRNEIKILQIISGDESEWEFEELENIVI